MTTDYVCRSCGAKGDLSDEALTAVVDEARGCLHCASEDDEPFWHNVIALVAEVRRLRAALAKASGAEAGGEGGGR